MNFINKIGIQVKNSTLILALLLFVGLSTSMVMPTTVNGQTYTLEQILASSNGSPVGTPIGVIDYDLLWTFNGSTWTSQSFNNGPNGDIATFGYIEYNGLTYIYGRTATDILYYTTDGGNNWTQLYIGGFSQSPNDMTALDYNGTLKWYAMTSSNIYEIISLASKTSVLSLGSMNSICSNMTDTVYLSRLTSGAIRGYSINDWSSYAPLGNASNQLDWVNNTLLSVNPGYVMQRSTNPSGSWSNVITLDPSDQIIYCTFLTDASVNGLDLAVGSATFDEIHVYRETVSPPSAPTATTASNVTQSSFDANWNASSGATGYRLDVATDNGFNNFVSGYNNLDVGNVTFYNVSGLSANTDYFYRVRAYNAGGNSPNSNIISVTTLQGVPVADFSGTPLTINVGQSVSFTDLSTNTPTSWAWTFGDGNTSTQQNPSNAYNSAGTFTVSLTATNSAGSDTETKNGYITVNELPPVADFTGTPTSGNAPLAVAFTDASTGNVSQWSWDFGDGGTLTQQNPNYTYTTAGTYTVALTVTGPGGNDTETKTDYITVNEPPPVADFTGTPTSGNAPLAVAFTDASTGSVTSWSWDFGDGGTSAQQNPNYTYTTAGTYTVALTVTGSGGNDTKTRIDYIAVGVPPAPPVAEFSGTPTSGDCPLVVNFTDLSTGSIDTWSWDFGDGGSSGAQNPAYTYSTAGTYTVALTVNGPGGSDTETKTDYITVSTPAPPVAEFSGNPTSGDNPLFVVFTDESTGSIDTWDWDFGDGGTSSQQSPAYTYNTAGTFTVALTVTGPGGSDDETKTDYIVVTEAAPVADFNGSPTSGAAPLDVQFTDASSGNVDAWDWDFGDGNTSAEQNPLHTYTSVNVYTVSLTVTGNGGTDTETKTDFITVTEPAPIADFSGLPTTGTAPLDVQFTDGSVGVVDSWAWDFGDGGTSTVQNPNHVYETPGSFSVSLTVIGSGGSNTETKVDYVLIPVSVNEITENGIKIYPNPTTGKLNLEFAKAMNRNLIITDASGKQCFTKKSSAINCAIDISQFTAGWYILSIMENNTVVKEFKVIKK